MAPRTRQEDAEAARPATGRPGAGPVSSSAPSAGVMRHRRAQTGAGREPGVRGHGGEMRLAAIFGDKRLFVSEMAPLH